jgi:hypothetical protein
VVSSLAFVDVLINVSFAPGIIAPLWSFTKPAMLPVGEAKTLGANIKTNVDRKVNIESNLDRFITASV